MAERRMISKKITDTDNFLDMPLSTQALYFHFLQNADDDGFVGNPNSIIRKINASKNDYDLLIVKKFVLVFESGVCVIKDWRIHNYIQTDRYIPTNYTDEKKKLYLNENKSYTLNENEQKIEIKNNEVKVVETNSVEKQIIDYLNEKAGTHFKYVDSNLKFIKARLKDYSEDDLKAVIDKKVSDWKNTNMQQYLRPETLFNATKFESYINGLNEKKKITDIEQRDYSKEEFESLYDNLDNIEV